MALSNGCYLHQIRGDCAAVEANLAALLELAGQKGIVVFYEIARVFQGWILACRGAVHEAIELARSALARKAATEQRLDEPYLISILAEIYLQAGRRREAQEQLDEALARVNVTDERWYEAELHRLAGEIALARGDTANAEAQFDHALIVARAQSARMWALRAATRLACVWHKTGKSAEVRGLLAPILDSFTEGFDSTDATGAKTLLDELADHQPGRQT
jgi:predicted ATPase